MKSAETCSIAWIIQPDLATGDDCNSRMALVYTNADYNINDYQFSNLETNPVPGSSVIKLVSRARMIERILLEQNQFSVSMEVPGDE